MSVCLPSASSSDLTGGFLLLPSLIDACSCICGSSAVRQQLPLRCEQFAFFGWGIMFTIIRVYSNGASSASLKGEHPVICRTPRHRRGSRSSLCHRNRPCARAPVVERIVAGHIRSLILNGEWQYISARGQCDMRATRNTMPSHSSSHSRAPSPPGLRASILLNQEIKGTQPDQNAPVIAQERTTGPRSLRTWSSRV